MSARPTPAVCELGECGVLAVGRCSECERAFCGSHQAIGTPGLYFDEDHGWVAYRTLGLTYGDGTSGPDRELQRGGQVLADRCMECYLSMFAKQEARNKQRETAKSAQEEASRSIQETAADELRDVASPSERLLRAVGLFVATTAGQRELGGMAARFGSRVTTYTVDSSRTRWDLLRDVTPGSFAESGRFEELPSSGAVATFFAIEADRRDIAKVEIPLRESWLGQRLRTALALERRGQGWEIWDFANERDPGAFIAADGRNHRLPARLTTIHLWLMSRRLGYPQTPLGDASRSR